MVKDGDSSCLACCAFCVLSMTLESTVKCCAGWQMKRVDCGSRDSEVSSLELDSFIL